MSKSTLQRQNAECPLVTEKGQDHSISKLLNLVQSLQEDMQNVKELLGAILEFQDSYQSAIQESSSSWHEGNTEIEDW